MYTWCMHSMRCKTTAFHLFLFFIVLLSRLCLGVGFLRAPAGAPCSICFSTATAAAAAAAAAAGGVVHKGKIVVSINSLNPRHQQSAAAEEYLRLRNTFSNLSESSGGQQLLQQQEQLLLQQRESGAAAAAAAAAEYRRVSDALDCLCAVSLSISCLNQLLHLLLPLFVYLLSPFYSDKREETASTQTAEKERD